MPRKALILRGSIYTYCKGELLPGFYKVLKIVCKQVQMSGNTKCKSLKDERSMVSTLVNIPGYKVSEELYNGSIALVCRGYRETDSSRVVIKRLKNHCPSFSELWSFGNIQTYSLEPDRNGYALVVEDLGGTSLKKYFANVETEYIPSLQDFLKIAIALCNTLNILYRERMIHKDIKPSNILINPKTKQVKLMDFSIASLR